jgi:hypothetical protein
MFLNPPKWELCRFITPQDLKTPSFPNSVKFVTSEILESLSVDPNYLEYSIGIYDTESKRFFQCILGDIGILSTLLTKKN